MTVAPPRVRGFVAAATARPRALVAAVAVCVLVAVGAIVTLGASGPTSPHASAGRTGAGPGASGSATQAVRWWSNSRSKVGSTIDPAAPLAVANRLHSSRKDYCGMLRETLATHGSVLAGVTAADPAVLTTTRAFVGELRAVAPHTVADPWRVLGNAMIALVSLGGRPTGVQGVDELKRTHRCPAAITRRGTGVVQVRTGSCRTCPGPARCARPCPTR